MEYDFGISYDDVADYIFDTLILLGHAPSGDEVLDLTDMFLSFFLQSMEQVGIDIVVTDDFEEED